MDNARGSITDSENCKGFWVVTDSGDPDFIANVKDCTYIAWEMWGQGVSYTPIGQLTGHCFVGSCKDWQMDYIPGTPDQWPEDKSECGLLQHVGSVPLMSEQTAGQCPNPVPEPSLAFLLAGVLFLSYITRK